MKMSPLIMIDRCLSSHWKQFSIFTGDLLHNNWFASVRWHAAQSLEQPRLVCQKIDFRNQLLIQTGNLRNKTVDTSTPSISGTNDDGWQFCGDSRWLHFHRLLENRLRTNLRYLFNSFGRRSSVTTHGFRNRFVIWLTGNRERLTRPTNSFPFIAVSLTTFIARRLYVSFKIMHDIELS